MNDMTNTTIVAPTLSSSAMLVELGISVWTASKRDKRASEEVTTSNRAQRGAARVNKSLLAGCAELDAIQKFAGNTRTLHYHSTLPWSDTGLRLIPTAKYFDYHKQMTGMQQEFNRLVEAFLGKYEWEINSVQLKLGDLFNPDDYPSLSKVRSKFDFRLNYIPMPETGDFRVDIGDAAQRELKEKYEAFYSAQLTRAMNDVWQRAYEALSRMSERLDYSSKEDKKIFRDSLVENVLDVIDIMDSMNITNDPNMQLQQRRLKMALTGVTPEALRESAHLRAETKRAVDEVIKTLPSLDF